MTNKLSNTFNQLFRLLLASACTVALMVGDGLRSVQAVVPTVPTAAIAGCANNYSIDVTMAIGTRWEMCWDRDAQRGLLLNQITFTPRGGTRQLIIGSAALAQLYVAYDDNASKYHYVTDNGLPLAALAAADCPNGTLRNDANNNPVLCQQVLPRGYAWRGTAQVQGSSLIVFAVSNINTETVIHQWVFDDDGTIKPMLGTSGKLAPAQTSNANTGWALGNGATRYATSRFITAYWRVNFDVGGSANDAIEEFNYSGTGNTRTQAVTRFGTEQARTVSPDEQRFWRVLDTQITNSNGHNISYQVVPQRTAVQRGSEAFTRNDVYATLNKPCEQFASHNPSAGGCSTQATDFVNGESLAGDVVVWLGSTWHHVPRDEDEPVIRTRWQGWTLMPRDLMPTSPFN